MKLPESNNNEWKPLINKVWTDKLKRLHDLMSDPRLTDAIAELGRRKLLALKDIAEIKAFEQQLKAKKKNG